MLSPTGRIQVRGPDPVAGSGGAFGASRIRNGRPYNHRGLDLVTMPWKALIAPQTCMVSRIGFAYPEDFRYHSIVLLSGDYEMKILYAWPYVLKDTRLQRGQVFALAEDLAARYPKVTNHVHLQVRKRGAKNWIDPLPYLREAA